MNEQPNDEYQQPHYEQGYQSVEPPSYVPPQYQPPPQQYQQPYPYPYPQQMQPQIIINNTINPQQMMYRPMYHRPQINVWIRLLYFLLLGWWLGMVWIMLALFLICTIIGLGVGVLMFKYLPAVMTLQQG
jgi:Inner membrane component domain